MQVPHPRGTCIHSIIVPDSLQEEAASRTEQKVSLERLIQELSVNRDGHNLPRNEFSTVLERTNGSVLQSAAARNLHADDGHTLDLVALNNLGKLFAVIHIVQLRAADQWQTVDQLPAEYRA